MSVRTFPWQPESELLVWCARTSVPEALQARIRQRIQQSLDWEVVLDLAAYHGVVALLYRNLSSICPNLVPGDSMTRLRQKTQAGAMLNRSLAEELGVLCEAFAVRGVPVIPIKGATLAVSAYGDVTLRDFSDLDLVIPERAIGDAQSILFAEGYERKHPSTDPAEVGHEDGPYHVFVKKRTLFRVDIQWVMAHEHFTFRLDRPEFWGHRTPVALGNKTVQGLAPEELLIVLCVHGSKHAWELLKWVCDVAEVIRAHPNLDWDRVFSQASAWRCRRVLSIGLALAHLVLDAPLPDAVRARYTNDLDVQMLSHRMPASLLASSRQGIGEEQAVALYFALKDSWWERWRFALILCRDESPIVTAPPAWVPWRSALIRLSRFVRPVQWVIRMLIPSGVRGTVNRWIEHEG